VLLWNADTGQPLGQALTGHTDAVYGVVFSPDGQRVASASYDNTVRVGPDVDYMSTCPGLSIAADDAL
jgi:WD40 repeat protein